MEKYHIMVIDDEYQERESTFFNFLSKEINGIDEVFKADIEKYKEVIVALNKKLIDCIEENKNPIKDMSSRVLDYERTAYTKRSW